MLYCMMCISVYATDALEYKEVLYKNYHSNELYNTMSNKLQNLENNITSSSSDNLSINIYNNNSKTQYLKLIEEVLKNTPPHPYEPREILYIDEYYNTKHILKLNVLQFNKYKFNKFTKQISKSSEYYKEQNIIFKKQQRQLYPDISNEEIKEVSLQFYQKFYIDEDEDFDYYIELLSFLLKGSDIFNDDINKGLYNSNELFKNFNYANRYDIEFTFDVFIENICNTMKNSDQVKEYDLEDLESEIHEFRIGLQKNIDNKKKRDIIWDEFISYIE